MFRFALSCFLLLLARPFSQLEHQVGVQATTNGTDEMITPASSEPLAASFPVIGRTTSGTWRNLPFTLFYYIDFEEVSGPVKKKECLLSALEAQFAKIPSSTVEAMTREQLQGVLRFAKEAAIRKRAEDQDRSFHLEERKHEERDENGQVTRVWYGPIPRVGDKFHGGAHHPPQSSPRSGLAYTFDANLALFLDGKYIDAYVNDETVLSTGATREEFEAFLSDTVPSLFATGEFRSGQVMSRTTECGDTLIEQEDFWQLEDKEALFHNTKVLGRKASFSWPKVDVSPTGGAGAAAVSANNNYEFEVFSFVEFFRWGQKYNDDNLKACYYDAVDSKFFEDTLDDLQQEQQQGDHGGDSATSTSSAIKIEVSKPTLDEMQQLREISWREEERWNNPDYFFWQNSLGSLRSYTSMQHGAVIRMDGENIESVKDNNMPAGVEEYVSAVLEGLIATPFEVDDYYTDIPYEISDLKWLNNFMLVFAGWLDECQPSS